MPQGTIALKDQFMRELGTLRGNGYPGWYSAIREQHAKQFDAAEFPTQRTEDWRFTNIKPILSTAFETVTPADAAAAKSAVAPYLFGDATWTELVFVDGVYAADLSRIAHKGIVAGSLAAALHAQDVALESHLGRLFDKKPSVFNALNTALASDGAYVSVPKNAVVDGAIHLVYVTTDRPSPVATHPRTLVIAGQSSQVTLLETYASLSTTTASFCNAAVEIFLEPNAQVTRYKLLAESELSYNLTSTRVRLDRDAKFESYVFNQSGKIVRDDLAVALDGEGAGVELSGLYMTSGDQLVDNATSIEHVKPHCSSYIGYKGVLDDSSHGVFSGKIFVHREAQKTDSNQLNQNLLLSDKATINTKPLLEIFADDVKCTHGATIGQHPEELIFYFRTRAMSEAMARGMLTYGFADEVVNKVALEPLRHRLETFVFDRYSPK